MNSDELEDNLNRIHEWLRAADQKVGIFLAFQGVVISLLFPKMAKWICINLLIFSWLEIILTIFGLVLLSYGLTKSVVALIPRLKKNLPKSIIYFGDIAEMRIDDFKEEISKLNGKRYEDELIKQIHICAIIAKKKHEQFRESIITFMSGLAVLGLIYILVTTAH